MVNGHHGGHDADAGCALRSSILDLGFPLDLWEREAIRKVSSVHAAACFGRLVQRLASSNASWHFFGYYPTYCTWCIHRRPSRALLSIE